MQTPVARSEEASTATAHDDEQKTAGASRAALLTLDDLQKLIDAFAADGYTVVGPTVHDRAVVYGEITSVADFPGGEIDEQKPGSYRLEKHATPALFAHSVGAESAKTFLFPSSTRLWSATRRNGSFSCEVDVAVPPRIALIGVRPCELAAIAIQDRVFMGGPYVDPGYTARRSALFVVAVNCARAGNNCFCSSLGTGPAATSGFDLALTEIVDEGRHEFVVESGTEEGAAFLARVPHADAPESAIERADAIVRDTAANITRKLDIAGLREVLYARSEHPRWEQVAKRCLTCANCTQVCPTCFCSTVEDVTDLTGAHAERLRRWDSCFTLAFSYVVGGSVRTSGMSRYRQWLTHKFAAWHDQFGSAGCVGCGRCITWCPAGIDITEELAALRAEGEIHPQEVQTEV